MADWRYSFRSWAWNVVFLVSIAFLLWVAFAIGRAVGEAEGVELVEQWSGHPLPRPAVMRSEIVERDFVYRRARGWR